MGTIFHLPPWCIVVDVIKSNAPENYVCPICLGVKGIESSDTLMKPSDVVYKDDLVTVFINSFFMGKNAGHVIIVPNEHFESIYDLPQKYGHRVFDVAQKMAVALKEAHSCDGITTRQNNEPAGDQHAFHYHYHVFPRYKMTTTIVNCLPKNDLPSLKNVHNMLRN